MRIATPVRIFLARHRWIYWLVVAVLALTVGFGVAARTAELDERRASWEETRSVWVAEIDTEPGDLVTAVQRDLPLVAVPTGAVDEVAPSTVARQRLRRGEVVVDADVVVGRGPAAGADDGQVVVPIGDPLLTGADIGLDVAVYAEGIVLAESGRIVHVDGEVVFVAVGADEGPVVAAAAQTRTASIAFTR